jgi:hypothetical protein
MGLHEDGEAGKLSPGDLLLGQATGSICSLNEAWFYALNKCVTGTPMSQGIVPLMRSCFSAERCTQSSCCKRVVAISWLPILPASSWNSRGRETQRLRMAST